MTFDIHQVHKFSLTFSFQVSCFTLSILTLFFLHYVRICLSKQKLLFFFNSSTLDIPRSPTAVTQIMTSDKGRLPSPAPLPPSKQGRLTLDEAIAEMMRHNDKIRANEM